MVGSTRPSHEMVCRYSLDLALGGVHKLLILSTQDDGSFFFSVKSCIFLHAEFSTRLGPGV